MRSPTLCGSPTVISKLGLAACSILTLGCVGRLELSIPPGAIWPCCERLCFELIELLSSSLSSAESIVSLFAGGCDEDVERALRVGSVCSLDGGAGGNSVSERLAFSPNGPSGPRESSMASKRVACAPTFRGVRGPLALVVLGVEIDNGEDACDSLALGPKSTYTHEAEYKLNWAPDIPFPSSSAALVRLALELDREGTSAYRQSQ